MVNTVKVRRVGNSNVVSLPRDLEQLGFREGTAVVVVPTPTGEVLLIPAERLDTFINELGARVIEENREALEKLAAYDRRDVHAPADS